MKWRVYVITFASHALVHGVRISWASVKPNLNSQPFSFSSESLGLIDMLFLISLSVSAQLFAWKVQSSGAKKVLLVGFALTVLIMVIISILFFQGVNSYAAYLITYAVLVGMFSSFSWPVCLYILSRYFDHTQTTSLAIWNGSNQAGYVVVVLISLLIVQQWHQNIGVSFLVVAIIIAALALVNYFLLPSIQPNRLAKAPDIKPNDAKDQIKELDLITEKKMIPSEGDAHLYFKVNFLNVWLIPGVIFYVLSYAAMKSVDFMILSWLIFYMKMIGMVNQAKYLAVSWALSMFLGGIGTSLLTSVISKRYMVACLLICAFLFIFLEEIRSTPHQVETFFSVFLCGLIYGGPFALMSTSIPLMLGQKPTIRYRPNAKPVIISVMYGVSHVVGAFSVILVATIGVIDLHLLSSLFCLLSALFLGLQIIRDCNQRSVSNQWSQRPDINGNNQDGMQNGIQKIEQNLKPEQNEQHESS